MDLSLLAGPAGTNLLTLVLVVVTGAYVYLTWKIAQANQEMLESLKVQYRESMRPLVYPSLTFREQVVSRLTIRNSGRSPAYDLRVSLDRDFFQFAERRNIREFGVFNEPISAFPPGAEISIDLAQGFNLDKELDGKNVTPSKFVVTLNYRSKFETYSEDVLIDVSPYAQVHFPKTTAEHLSVIESHLRKMASG